MHVTRKVADKEEVRSHYSSEPLIFHNVDVFILFISLHVSDVPHPALVIIYDN